MSTATAKNQHPESSYSRILEQTLDAFALTRSAAKTAVQAVNSGDTEHLQASKHFEEQLDRLDREVNEGVTAAIAGLSEPQGRELLASLKLVIELERITDLLLGFVNRSGAVASRLEAQDVRDLTVMTGLLEKMLSDAFEAYRQRDLNRAVAVLRADAELDRLRNLIFVRHIENPEGFPRQESFHLVFMTQALERCGDHAKNLAEEVCQLMTGRSIRHLLRAHDKPFENMFVDWVRRKGTAKKS